MFRSRIRQNLEMVRNRSGGEYALLLLVRIASICAPSMGLSASPPTPCSYKCQGLVSTAKTLIISSPPENLLI